MEEMKISELMVLHSAAGYYIGRECDEGWGWMPYSRESMDYYKTLEEAQEALDNKTYRYRGWV